MLEAEHGQARKERHSPLWVRAYESSVAQLCLGRDGITQPSVGIHVARHMWPVSKRRGKQFPAAGLNWLSSITGKLLFGGVCLVIAHEAWDAAALGKLPRGMGKAPVDTFSLRGDTALSKVWAMPGSMTGSPLCLNIDLSKSTVHLHLHKYSDFTHYPFQCPHGIIIPSLDWT